MTIAKIKEILKGEFKSPVDRKYWEDRLKAEIAKERRIKENDIYFKEYFKYSR